MSHEELLNEATIYVNNYIEDSARETLNRLERIMRGEGCCCRNCTTGTVALMNSYIQMIAPPDAFEECGDHLLFEVDEHLNIQPPRWYFAEGENDEGTDGTILP